MEEGSDRKYFRTGDLGFLDETNQIFITDRIKDFYIIKPRLDSKEEISISEQGILTGGVPLLPVNRHAIMYQSRVKIWKICARKNVPLN